MTPQPLLRPSVELFLGKSGTGKTRLALSRIGPEPCILFDLNEQPALSRNAVICTTAAELVRALDSRQRRICWRGHVTMGAAGFDWANRCAWEWGGRVVFWDEVDQLMPVHPVSPWAYRLINAGRHRGVTIKATARRPASMSRHVTAAATAVWCFKVTGRRDVRYLGDEWFHGTAGQLPALERGQALAWTEAGGETLKKIW